VYARTLVVFLLPHVMVRLQVVVDCVAVTMGRGCVQDLYYLAFVASCSSIIPGGTVMSAADYRRLCS
jgi:hypothetical protein